jgi:hypothetical protein
MRGGPRRVNRKNRCPLGTHPRGGSGLLLAHPLCELGTHHTALTPHFRVGVIEALRDAVLAVRDGGVSVERHARRAILDFDKPRIGRASLKAVFRSERTLAPAFYLSPQIGDGARVGLTGLAFGAHRGH